MNTLRNTEECRQNQANIDLAAEKPLVIADKFLLDLFAEVKHYFDCFEVSAIRTLSTLLMDHVRRESENLPENMEDMKHLISDIDRDVTYVSATIALISELHMHWETVEAYRQDALTNPASIFFKPETALSK